MAMHSETQSDGVHRRPELSVVIPVYRSKDTLRELLRRIIESFSANEVLIEVIMVEDCGRDGSWHVIESLAADQPVLRGIRLSRNFGQHAATICGMAMARGHWVATMDDDLEQSPEKLPELLQKAKEGYDLVYGVYPERTHAAWRNITSHLARLLFKLAIPTLNDTYTSMRVVRGDLARELKRFDSPFPFVDGYLSWLTSRCACMEVSHQPRPAGKSNYTFSKLFAHTLNIFVTFSDAPLKLASNAGLVFSLIGFSALVFILIGRLIGAITAVGYASVMATILAVGGIQLLVLGIFGEYIGRINFKTSRKPLYLVAFDTQTGDRS
jgi:glycosyltransferase involved in cell wall biosynthesis